MSHKGAQETFDRHLPLFAAHGCDIIVYSPCDAPCETRGHLGVLYGTASHHDAMANRRFKRLLSFLANTNYDRHFICEYDAFCIKPNIPIFFEWGDFQEKDFTRPYLAANVFRDNSPDRKFVGTTFCHPPLLFSRQGLATILPHLNALADDCEFGFWDRYLGLACENAGIEPMDFMKHGLGFARNTIEFGRDCTDATDAAANGAIFFHGCKSVEALTHIKVGYATAKANGKHRHGLEVAL